MASLDEVFRVAAEDSPDDVKLVAAASPAIVKIVTFDRAGAERGRRSCFAVSEDGRLATNVHEVRGAHPARVMLASGAGLAVGGFGPARGEWDRAGEGGRAGPPGTSARGR